MTCPAELSLCFSIIPRTFFKNAFTFFLEGVVSTAPLLYLRTCCPRKSKPSLICVITVFSCDNWSPRSFRNLSMNGFTSCSKSSFEAPVTIKSSAYLARLTFGLFPCFDRGKRSKSCWLSPSSAIFAMTGEIIPPCGVPSSVGCRTFSSIYPAFSHFLSVSFSMGM